jgi:hypothetical protein
VNETPFNVTIASSMMSTHYYENNVKPGEIWYRWPGAVHETLYAFPSKGNEITDGRVVIENITAGAAGIMAAAVIIATCGTAAAPGSALMPLTLTPAALALYSIPQAVGIAVSVATLMKIAAAVGLTKLVFDNFEKADNKVSKLLDFINVLKTRDAQLYTEMKGCYAGGSGTWLALRFDTSDAKFKFVTLTREEVF